MAVSHVRSYNIAVTEKVTTHTSSSETIGQGEATHQMAKTDLRICVYSKGDLYAVRFESVH